jgi:hypothetical protein
MRTTAGFYPKARNIRNEILEEKIEVIKVEPRSDDESEVVSEVSEGGGWLTKNDERNKLRSLQNKTLWKIMDERSEEKPS